MKDELAMWLLILGPFLRIVDRGRVSGVVAPQPWWLWPLIVVLSLAVLIVEALRGLDERMKKVMR